jgi:hypothetical protein
MRILLLVVLANNFFCSRLLIQQFNQFVFVLCLFALPGIFYAIQWINLNCTVYSRKEIDLLSKYACQLKFLKLKHEQLTNDLNNMALATEE